MEEYELGLAVQHLVQPEGTPRANGYSHVVVFSGGMVAVSGQVPLDASRQLVGENDPGAQIRQVFENLSTALAATGASMAEVVKLSVYLTDHADLAAFRQILDEYAPLETPPASTLVQVSALVSPAFRVEIDALAAI
jgi:enamine deaminase RidA (YjgF/YER057c/UK114 family)